MEKLKRMFSRAAAILLKLHKRNRPFCVILMMLITTTTAWAADITQNTAVVINSGNKAKYHNKSVAGTVSGTSEAGNIDYFISKGAIVVDGIELNLTIDGFNVNYSDRYTTLSGISLVNGAKLHLTVKGTNTLTAGYGGAGIAVPFGCSLEITAASTGTLNAKGGKNYGGGAGIGSSGNGHITQDTSLYPQGCGDITINGGTINAQGGTWYVYYTATGGAAGIGSSEFSGWTVNGSTFGDNTYVNNITGNITINGGTVHATGAITAAGIGGGNNGTVKSITITGGNVTATAGSRAAAIGSGYSGATDQEDKLTCANISITGGSVTANGNIGYGEARGAGTNVGGNVTIGEAVVLNCSGTISPSTYCFRKRTFHITAYDASLTATASNVPVQLPVGKTVYNDLLVVTPGIGTAAVDALYADDQLVGSGTLTVRGFTSEALSLSQSSHDIALGGYCYDFSGTIYDKSIALGTTATISLDGVSDIYVNATYTPETAGFGTTAGVARFSGYFITPSELSDEQTFRVTDSNNHVYKKTVTFPATVAHKSDLNFTIADGSGVSEVKYIDENNTEQTCTSFQLLDNSASWGTEGNTSWLMLYSDITVNERITVSGTVNLILCDGASLTAREGISVLEGNSLNIYGQQSGTGRLTADCGNKDNYAGIGGYSIVKNYTSLNDYACGSISIYGGTITAIGGYGAAGIGGSICLDGGTVRIFGGTVTATGGNMGAGIGSGYSRTNVIRNGGTIEISGGTVTATGQAGAAGIGGGRSCHGGTITINGGTITARSVNGVYDNWGAATGAGIGGGIREIYDNFDKGGSAGVITINGGTIIARSDGTGMGVGTGGAGTGSNGYGGSGGSVRLGWTNLTDAIYANSYGGENCTVTFSNNFMLQGTDTKATTDNIGDKTIVPPCNITFDANGGSGTMNNVMMAAGATYQLPECAFTAPTDKIFYRWQIGTTEYEPGTSITVSSEPIVTALWREGSRTVTFNMNGHGSDIEAQTVPYSTAAMAPDPAPTAEGYEFAGWYVGETPYDFNTLVTAHTELTAHWSKIVDAPTLTVTGSYTYTGEQIIPTVIVKDGETVVSESEYTVTTTNTTKAGTATATITDKAGGDYKLGSVNAEFEVAKKSVVVSGITGKNKHLDNSASAELDCSHAVFSGTVEGDVLTVSATGTFDDAVVGENKKVSISDLTLGGRDKDNYVLADEGQQATATATIYAPHTVTFADETSTMLDGFPVETVLNGQKATDPTTDANRPVKDGYRFMGWNYGDEAFDFDTPLDFETTTALTLTPRFLKLHSVAGAPYDGTGTGRVTFDKTVAVAGEEVTVTASPNEGSELASLSIYYTEDNKNTDIHFTMTDENQAKFTMPDKDEVHVGGVFTLSSNLLAGLKNNETGYYEVTKAADLVLICTWMAAGNQMENETIQLKNDIDVSGSRFKSFPYMKKGTSQQYVFLGTLDGNHHTISGININNDGSAGLFGVLGGTVKDLTVIGSVSGSGNLSSVGSIAQAVQESGRIQDCVSLVEVTSGYTTFTGGIAGTNDGTISDCYYLGAGVPGTVGSYSNNVAAINCTALYAVDGSDNENSGVVTLGNTTSDGTIYGDRYHEAGSQVTMTLTAGGKDGWTLRGFKYQNNSYEDVNLTDNGNGTYTLTVPEENVTLLPNYRYDGLTLQQDAQNRYLVTSVADLNEVATVTSVLDGCSDMTFLLTNDIEFGENDSFGGIAVGLTDEYGNDVGFNGTFDGGGHTIYGMNIERKAQNLGFIGYLTGTLQNLTLAYCTVNNTSDAVNTYAGMLVGYSYNGYLSHCRVIGGEVSGANAGAIFGYSYAQAEDNLYNDEVAVVSGGNTMAPGTCGTSEGDDGYKNAALIGWRVIFLDDSGQLAPAQLVADRDAAIKPEVNPAPREHFTCADKWKRGNSGTEYTFTQSWQPDNITANTTLYLIWEEESKYTVTYSGNGGSGSDVSQQVYASEVSSFHLPDCFYDAPEGCHFSAWRIGGNDYAPGVTVDFSGNITVTAQWERNAFELADNTENTTVINTWKNKVADVTLKKRTLYKDGAWNTLCLPFDVTIASSPLAGDNVVAMMLDAESSGLSGTTLTLNFEPAQNIPAGIPFIIKWDNTSADLTETDLVFSGVTINSTSTEISFTGGTFKGTYSPVPFSANDQSILFLGAANKLYWPNAVMTLNACRAYFQLDDGQQAREFVLNFGDNNEVATGILTTNFSNFTNSDAWYTLDGRKLQSKPTTKGIYINNGKKTVIK